MLYALLTSLIFSLMLLWNPVDARQYVNSERYSEENISSNQPFIEQSILKATQAKLNIVYKKMINALENKPAQELAQAQLDWKNYSTAECAYISDNPTVTLLHPVSYSECLIQLTNDRIDELQSQLDGLELIQPGLSKP